MAFDPKWTMGWELKNLIPIAQRMGYKVMVLDVNGHPTPFKTMLMEHPVMAKQWLGSDIPQLNVGIRVDVKQPTTLQHILQFQVPSVVNRLYRKEDVVHPRISFSRIQSSQLYTIPKRRQSTTIRNGVIVPLEEEEEEEEKKKPQTALT